MLEWKRVTTVEGLPDATAVMLGDENVSQVSFEEVWRKFFTDVFPRSESGRWDVVHCDVLYDNWRIEIYPYSMRDHEPKNDARLWVDLVDHYAALDPLMKGDVYLHHQSNLIAIQGNLIDRIIRLLLNSLSSFSRKENLWTDPVLQNVTIRIHEYNDDLKVSISRQGISTTAIV
jgi:hypothetical protein